MIYNKYKITSALEFTIRSAEFTKREKNMQKRKIRTHRKYYKAAQNLIR